MGITSPALHEFIAKLDKVVEHIEIGKEIKAQYLFNTTIAEKYNTEEWFSEILPFYVALNEYLNVDHLFDLGEEPSKEELLETYASEYKKSIDSLRRTS